MAERTTGTYVLLGLTAFGILAVTASALGVFAGAAVTKGILTIRGGAVIEPHQEAYLRRLRRETPASIPLRITSGTQTIEAQTRNILKYVYEAGGGAAGDGAQAMRDTYGDLSANRLLALPPTVEAWSAEVQKQKDEGIMRPGHTEGDAVDVSVHDLTSDQIDEVIAAAKRAGAQHVVLEHATPLIHIDTLG